MTKVFNVNGACKPDLHYMVDIESRLKQIKKMVDTGEYFCINRARQYGKTTTLQALVDYLSDSYIVISLDFQRISHLDFENEVTFVHSFSREIVKRMRYIEGVPTEVRSALMKLADKEDRNVRLGEVFDCFNDWCEQAEKPVVLMIDEVDTASNNQVFLDLLARLRADYLDRDITPAFQSVILAGVYDVSNLKQKIRPDQEHKRNSPWNIAAKFRVDMSFSAEDIAGMLKEYEKDCHTGMDIRQIASLIYDYTSGYPYLVSSLCKKIDEEVTGSEGYPDKEAAWTKTGVLEAVKKLLEEKNTLFESLMQKLSDYPELENMIYLLLFQGKAISYNLIDLRMDMLLMFGFVRVESGIVQIANRIFETLLYNYFTTLPAVQNGEIYKSALRNKSQFVCSGRLDMKRVLEKFVEYFDDVYGDQDQRFVEEDGRRYFMLYLKPIINGVGNYYVEARTRNQERTDLILDYRGEQFIIEMKIWHGNAYNERGEEQLSGYLEHYHSKKGYMLSFNFNKNKEIGVKEVQLGDKILIEAVV